MIGGAGSVWHAAKLRLTHVFFPLGFIALAEIVHRARPRWIIGVHRRCRAELGIHSL